MKNEIPSSIVWVFEAYDIKNKRYLKDLEFIKNNMAVNHIVVSVRNGVELQNTQQCHGIFSEFVEKAHELGLKVSLHFTDSMGFYNSIFKTDNVPAVDQVELFPIPDPKKAAALVNDIELVTDGNGFVEYTHTPKWARKKIMPIYSEIIKVFTFDKTGEGFYREDSLTDVTEKILITDSRTNKLSFEIDLGEENKNKNVFVLLAQYYNYPSVADAWDNMKNLIDAYSDIPLDGLCLDEYGYMRALDGDTAFSHIPDWYAWEREEVKREILEGKYSLEATKTVCELGYTTVFWSFGYEDWDNGKQMPKEKAMKKILDNTHDGAIILLHPTSATNAEIMSTLITRWKEMGYKFGTLYELVERSKK